MKNGYLRYSYYTYAHKNKLLQKLTNKTLIMSILAS